MRTGSMLDDISSLGCFNQYETIKTTLTEGIKKYYLNLSFNEDDSIISLSINKDHQEMFELMSIVNKAKCFEDVLNARSDIKEHYEALAISAEEQSRLLAETIKTNYKDHFKFNGNHFKRRTKKSNRLYK